MVKLFLRRLVKVHVFSTIRAESLLNAFRPDAADTSLREDYTYQVQE